jgi:hypothetical protein
METCGWVDVWIHVFLTSALVEGEWLVSRPGRFIPGERASSTHWIGSWVGPGAGLGLIIMFMALQLFVGLSPLLQFLDPVHSRYDSLD